MRGGEPYMVRGVRRIQSLVFVKHMTSVIIKVNNRKYSP